MSADLALEIHRRNARLRAWRAYGVPVEGGWEGTGLMLRCGVCLGPWRGVKLSGHVRTQHLAWQEVQLVRAMRRRDCPHLAPLLGDDPPEVTAIAELELLAG
jgi:hypothetical protein